MPARSATARSAPGAGVVSLVGVALPREQVAEIQRARLLTAAVSAIEECGYAGTTVGHITDRARVSRRTFYELFADREECLAAVLDDALGMVESELAAAGVDGLGWRTRVRMGLWTILCFLDREPALARVCVVHAAQAGPGVQRRREAILARLAAVVDEGRREGARGASQCGPLTAEGLVGAAFMILYKRLQAREPQPLAGLLGELVGMIVLPYLGPGVSRRERAKPPLGPLRAARRGGGARRPGTDALSDVPMRLTYRTLRVLAGVAEHPGASNREVADRAGIQDPGQVSKLLARLERLGMLANVGAGHVRGEPNAWVLSARGERVAQSIRLHTTAVSGNGSSELQVKGAA
jgi:AcrR family transcriptional regulator